jgi:hypothetical protein
MRQIAVSSCSVSTPLSSKVFPRSVCLLSGRKIRWPILGIYKSLTDTRMWILGLRPRNSFSGNTWIGFSLQCRRPADVSRPFEWGIGLLTSPKLACHEKYLVAVQGRDTSVRDATSNRRSSPRDMMTKGRVVHGKHRPQDALSNERSIRDFSVGDTSAGNTLSHLDHANRQVIWLWSEPVTVNI